MDVNPLHGCTDTLDPNVGCTGTDTASATAQSRMDKIDAIVFGDYSGQVSLAVQEWNLGKRNEGYLHDEQDLSYMIQLTWTFSH